jgi:hypothetical protein
MSDIIRYVLPGLLRASVTRLDGADPMKLQDQFNEFGFSAVDMPPVEVTLGMNGEMMINDGMTRATRCCMIDVNQSIAVNVIEQRSNWDFSDLPTIAELLTPDF